MPLPPAMEEEIQGHSLGQHWALRMHQPAACCTPPAALQSRRRATWLLVQRTELGSGSPGGFPRVTWLLGDRGDPAILGTWHGQCGAGRNMALGKEYM